MRHRLGLATRTRISVCKSPFPSAGTAVSLFLVKTVQQRPLLPREVETWLPDCVNWWSYVIFIIAVRFFWLHSELWWETLPCDPQPGISTRLFFWCIWPYYYRLLFDLHIMPQLLSSQCDCRNLLITQLTGVCLQCLNEATISCCCCSHLLQLLLLIATCCCSLPGLRQRVRDHSTRTKSYRLRWWWGWWGWWPASSQCVGKENSAAGWSVLTRARSDLQVLHPQSTDGKIFSLLS